MLIATGTPRLQAFRLIIRQMNPALACSRFQSTPLCKPRKAMESVLSLHEMRAPISTLPYEVEGA
jgi:hypothetical protein